MKWRHILGICVLVLGLIFALWILIGQVRHCQYMWENEFKALNFDSFSSYFFSVSKGTILISATIAMTSVSFGRYLCRGKA